MKFSEKNIHLGVFTKFGHFKHIFSISLYFLAYSLSGSYNTTKKCKAPCISDSDLKKCDLCLPLVYPPPIAWVAKYFEKKSVCINDTHQYILYVWKTGRFYLSEYTVHNVLLAKLNINEQISYEFLIRLIQRLIIRLIRRLAIGRSDVLFNFCLSNPILWIYGTYSVGGGQ